MSFSIEQLKVINKNLKSCYMCDLSANYGFAEIPKEGGLVHKGHYSISCKEHGKPYGMIKITEYYCKYNGCNTYSTWGPSETNERIYCKVHAEPGMICQWSKTQKGKLAAEKKQKKKDTEEKIKKNVSCVVSGECFKIALTNERMIETMKEKKARSDVDIKKSVFVSGHFIQTDSTSFSKVKKGDTIFVLNNGLVYSSKVIDTMYMFQHSVWATHHNQTRHTVQISKPVIVDGVKFKTPSTKVGAKGFVNAKIGPLTGELAKKLQL